MLRWDAYALCDLSNVALSLSSVNTGLHLQLVMLTELCELQRDHGAN